MSIIFKVSQLQKFIDNQIKEVIFVKGIYYFMQCYAQENKNGS